jgi:hypothetical protein
LIVRDLRRIFLVAADTTGRAWVKAEKLHAEAKAEGMPLIIVFGPAENTNKPLFAAAVFSKIVICLVPAFLSELRRPLKVCVGLQTPDGLVYKVTGRNAK